MAKPTVGLPRIVSRSVVSTAKATPQALVRLSRLQCRPFHQASSLQEEKLSFRGQLYESTAQRLARERAEEARYAAARNAQGNSTSRLFATTFCMRASLLLPELALTSVYSHPWRLRCQLLLRPVGAQRTPHIVHHTARCRSATAARHAGLGDASCLGGLCADCRQGERVYERGRLEIP